MTPLEYLQNSKDVDGWLRMSAGEAIQMLVNGMDLGDRPVCEIGVHHGKLFIFLALASQGKAVAFDLFDNQEENVDDSGSGNKKRFLSNCAEFGVAAERVIPVTANSMKLTPEALLGHTGGPVALFSIDGGHTDEITYNDLDLAAQTLADDGIVILDDVFTELFPEVAAGLFRFLIEKPGALVPFAFGGAKMFLARTPEGAAHHLATIDAWKPPRGSQIIDRHEREIYGNRTVMLQSYRPAQNMRHAMTRLPIWKQIRDTPLGKTIKRVAGS